MVGGLGFRGSEECRVEGSGLRVWGLGLRAWGSGPDVKGLGFRAWAQGLGYIVQILVQGLRSRV